MKILILDDELLNRIVLKEMLENVGELILVSSGKEAIFQFTSAISDSEPFDLLILDIMVPDSNGHEVLKRIRQIESELQTTQSVKVVMLTALSDFKNIQASFKLDCNGYLVKPISRDSLFDMLRSIEIISKHQSV